MSDVDEPVVKQEKKQRHQIKPRWKPGESGNPNGRPKKQFCIPDILTEILDYPFPEDKKITYLRAICLKAVQQAAKGDKDARNWVADRKEGKALERVKAAIVDKDEMDIDFG